MSNRRSTTWELDSPRFGVYTAHYSARERTGGLLPSSTSLFPKSFSVATILQCYAHRTTWMTHVCLDTPRSFVFLLQSAVPPLLLRLRVSLRPWSLCLCSEYLSLRLRSGMSSGQGRVKVDVGCSVEKGFP